MCHLHSRYSFPTAFTLMGLGMKNTSGSTINSIHDHPEAKLLRVEGGDQPDIHVSLGPVCKMPTSVGSMNPKRLWPFNPLHKGDPPLQTSRFYDLEGSAYQNLTKDFEFGPSLVQFVWVWWPKPNKACVKEFVQKRNPTSTLVSKHVIWVKSVAKCF